MADPLSIVASVIAIAQLTERLIALGYVYLGGTKAASKDLRELVNELQSLGKVLVVLQDYAQADQNLQSTALQSLNGQNGPLPGCALELRRLQLKLEPKQGLRGMIQSLKWPFKEQETQQHIARIQRQKSLFILALTVDHISLSKAIEAYVQNADRTAEEIKAGMQDINLTIHDLEARFIAEFSAQNSWRQRQDIIQAVESREKVLNWIYPGTVEKKHLEISSRRQKNTGNWLLRAPQFQELLDNHGSSLLWGYGIPGAGKTFLSSAVIDYLQDRQSRENYGVAYIYFDYKEQEDQRPIHILASLVKQLASQLPHLPKEVEDLHDKLRYQGKRPGLEELYATLLVTFQSFGRVFFVFDALDECDPQSQRKKLLPLFHRMAGDGASIFLTSRQYPEDIRQSFGDAKKINLAAKEEDIRTYIQEKIGENSRAERLIGQGDCKERIISELIKCAKGMSLLVKFHVEYICQQTTAKQILDALGMLKNSSTESPLDPTYDRVMDSLRKQPRTCKELAIKVLSWLVKARRTLTVEEIQTAVSVESGRYELDDLDLPDKATLLEVCASLVTIDEHSHTIRLAHYTVQDYLLRKLVIPLDTDLKLAMTCATFLSFNAFSTGPCMSNESLDARLQRYPFLEYAAHNLSPHLNACQSDEALSTAIVLRFLASPGNISSYLQIVHVWGYGKGDSEYCNRYPKDHLPLHVASTLGHSAVVRLLLEGADFSVPDNNGWENVYLAASKGHDAVVRLLLEKKAAVSASDNNGLTALHMAASHGHDSVVQLLLDKGSDVLLPCNSGETALHLAASQGHETVVRVLLTGNKRADVSIPDIKGRTALHIATSQGHRSVVQLLLERGADASVSDNLGETALHMAASKGHEEVIRLLLENDLSASAPNNFGHTALHLAAFQGNEIVIGLLLDNGADICALTNSKETALYIATSRGNAPVMEVLLKRGASIPPQANNRSTMLHFAARHGHEPVVKLLLENGADISAQEEDGSTALHLAVYNRHEPVVKLLLENGADISAQTKGSTALHLAITNGHEPIVKLLLENGADTSAQNEDGSTALHLAAHNGHEPVVKLLLENGADISAQNEDGWTALHLAARHGHEPVVKLLLENGADISAQNEDGWTALHLAAHHGHEPVVKLLLENGADISAQKEDGSTALHHAASEGHEPVVKLLLENGADTSAQEEEDGWTALHLAAHDGHEPVVKLLLENGADTSAQTKDGWTALHHAASEGHEPIVKLLLENGADTSAQEKDGSTVLELAKLHHHKAVVSPIETIGQITTEHAP